MNNSALNLLSNMMNNKYATYKDEKEKDDKKKKEEEKANWYQQNAMNYDKKTKELADKNEEQYKQTLNVRKNSNQQNARQQMKDIYTSKENTPTAVDTHVAWHGDNVNAYEIEEKIKNYLFALTNRHINIRDKKAVQNAIDDILREKGRVEMNFGSSVSSIGPQYKGQKWVPNNPKDANLEDQLKSIYKTLFGEDKFFAKRFDVSKHNKNQEFTKERGISGMYVDAADKSEDYAQHKVKNGYTVESYIDALAGGSYGDVLSNIETSSDIRKIVQQGYVKFNLTGNSSYLNATEQAAAKMAQLEFNNLATPTDAINYLQTIMDISKTADVVSERIQDKQHEETGNYSKNYQRPERYQTIAKEIRELRKIEDEIKKQEVDSMYARGKRLAQADNRKATTKQEE